MLRTIFGFFVLPILLLFSVRRSSRVAQWLRDLRSTRRAMIAMARFGYGSGERYWMIGIVALTLLWLIGGTLAICLSPEMEKLRTDYDVNISAEVFYRLVGLLGGSDEYLQTVGNAHLGEEHLKLSPALSWARWPALLLPFWVALPPLFAWLSRRGEPMAVRQLLSGHYLIVGYGQVGSALARNLLQPDAEDFPVVIVESATAGARLRGARRAGAIVIELDAHQSGDNYAAEDFVRDLAAQRAAGILIATGSASRNIDIAGRLARDIARVRKWDPVAAKVPMPRLVPHINDRRLMHWVTSKAGKAWLRGPMGPGEESVRLRPEIVPFSADQSAVRKLLSERPIASYAELRGVRRPHLVVLGHDTVAEWLIPQAVQAALVQNLDPPRVTWIVGERPGSDNPREETPQHADPEFERHADALRDYLGIDLSMKSFDFSHIDSSLFDLSHPLPSELFGVAEGLSGQAQPKAESFDWDDLKKRIQEGDPVTSIFICFGSDEQNLEVALHLQDLIKRERRWLAPTFVRLYRDSGLEDVLSRSEYQDKLSMVIDDFGQDDEVCTREDIFDAARDRAARRAHQVYKLGESISTLAEAVQVQRESREWQQRVDQRICAADDPAVKDDLRILRTMLDDESVNVESAVRQWLSREPAHSSGYACLSGGPAHRHLRKLEVRKLGIDTLCSGQANDASKENRRTKTGNDPWRNLDHEYIVSNRDHVDHLPAKLRGLGYRGITLDKDGEKPPGNLLCGPWPLRSAWEGHAASFLLGCGALKVKLPASLERTAEVEHERYMVERLIGGWRYGPTRDNIRRLHPSLLPYSSLDKRPEEKLKDQRSVIDVKMLLAALHPLRQWRPECRFGVIGSVELCSVEREALERACRAVLDAVLSLEYQRLERVMKPLIETDSDGEFCEPEDALKRAKSTFGLCLVSSGGQRPPPERAGQAASGSDWRLQQAMRAWAAEAVMPFRTVVARLTPGQDRVKGVPASGGVHQEDDHWEVDLLPEGVPLSALDHDIDLDDDSPEGNLLPYWSPGTDASSWSQERITREALQEIVDMRAAVWEGWFKPLAEEYVVEQSDWLVLIGTGDGADTLERSSQKGASSLGELTPAGGNWMARGTEIGMRCNMHDGDEGYEIRIDRGRRLVNLTLGR